MNVAEQLVVQFVDAGVHRIYGIVGDSLNPVADTVHKIGGSTEGGIDWVHIRHEETAAFATAAEAQLTGELSACAGPYGPGNLHLTNGLYDVQHSGTPTLAIVSCIPGVQVSQSYFQEIYPDRPFNECSVHSELIPTPKQTFRVVNAAIRHTISLSDVSATSLSGDVSDEKATAAIPEYSRTRPAILSPNPADVAEVSALLNKSRKVAIFIGVGIRGAHDEVIALADLFKAPIGHSLRGKDFIQYDSPCDIDIAGLLGCGATTEGMKGADILLLLETDLLYDQFLPDTMAAQVDNHAEKLGWHTDAFHPIHSDVIPFAEALILHIRKCRFDAFLKA